MTDRGRTTRWSRRWGSEITERISAPGVARGCSTRHTGVLPLSMPPVPVVRGSRWCPPVVRVPCRLGRRGRRMPNGDHENSSHDGGEPCGGAVELRALADDVARFVKGFDPAVVHPRDALAMVPLFVQLENLGAAGKALAADRVAGTDLWQKPRVSFDGGVLGVARRHQRRRSGRCPADGRGPGRAGRDDRHVQGREALAPPGQGGGDRGSGRSGQGERAPQPGCGRTGQRAGEEGPRDPPRRLAGVGRGASRQGPQGAPGHDMGRRRDRATGAGRSPWPTTPC